MAHNRYTYKWSPSRRRWVTFYTDNPTVYITENKSEYEAKFNVLINNPDIKVGDKIKPYVK